MGLVPITQHGQQLNRERHSDDQATKFSNGLGQSFRGYTSRRSPRFASGFRVLRYYGDSVQGTGDDTLAAVVPLRP